MSELFGDKYKIGLDESWKYAKGEDRDINRKWFEQALCAKGAFIYLYSENPLIFALYTPWTKKARMIANEIPGSRLDMLIGEAVVYFPSEHFMKVARLAVRGGKESYLKPIKKNWLSQMCTVDLKAKMTVLMVRKRPKVERKTKTGSRGKGANQWQGL